MSPSGSSAGRWWIGPLRPPQSVARRLLRIARRVGHQYGAWPVWISLSAFIGAAGPLADMICGATAGRILVAIALTTLLVGAIARQSPVRGWTAIGTVFLIRSAVIMAIVALAPQFAAATWPDGAEYWDTSKQWLLTGESREYDVGWWLPAQGQLLAGVVVFTYTSLGATTFFQGLREVDLMNFYVGSMLAASRGLPVALGVGWHPWSVCRGVGYMLVTYEVACLSFERLTDTLTTTAMRRCCRWVVGIAFLALDVVLKYLLLAPTREILLHNLNAL